MAIPSKPILAPTIPHIGAFTSLGWSRRRKSEAEIGGGGRRRVEVEVRVRIICGVVVEVKVVQASGFARGVSIPVFISLFQFNFFQCLNECRLNGLHM